MGEEKSEVLKFSFPIPSGEERLPTDVPQLAILYKLLKATREVLDKLERVETLVSPPKTLTGRLSNIEIPEPIIDLTGRGELREFLAISERSDFRVRVYVDGVAVYDGDYSWFKAVSQEVRDIAAFEKDGEYVFSITNIKFTKSLKVVVEPAFKVKPFTLKEVYYKLDWARGI